VDWCAGKAHLGRAIGFQWESSELCALERDPQLVEAAQALGRRHGLSLRAHACDVLSGDVGVHLAQVSQLVALHACGALHRRLLQAGASARVPAIDCAPCCYHLGPAGHLPRSAEARRHDPLLQPADLRTAVQDEVTAGGHARRRREQLQSWQLGCDALLREHAGQSRYTALPGASAELLAGDFAGYCRYVLSAKGFALPKGVQIDAFETRGRERFREVSALDLVRRRFRRLIELWLVTDLAVSLEESGYAVRLLQFCPATITPRNLLLQARLAA
jgi:hypothetical protein